MKATILNPNEVQGLFKEWGLFATQCYATPKEFAEKVGNSCLKTEHFSGSRTEYIKFEITGIDRGVAEQVMRHEIGTRCYPLDENSYDENPCNIVKNMQSFRYVDKEHFEYATPITIVNNNLANYHYEKAMDAIDEARKSVMEALILAGVKESKAIEDCNYLLPRATFTALTIGFTPEALIHYMHKRLCTRTQDFHQHLAKLMKYELSQVCPELSEKLVPHCDYLLWCPEGNRCCGRKPTKNKLIEKLGKELL